MSQVNCSQLDPSKKIYSTWMKQALKQRGQAEYSKVGSISQGLNTEIRVSGA
jgi:hypothetical protein